MFWAGRGWLCPGSDARGLNPRGRQHPAVLYTLQQVWRGRFTFCSKTLAHQTRLPQPVAPPPGAGDGLVLSATRARPGRFARRPDLGGVLCPPSELAPNLRDRWPQESVYKEDGERGLDALRHWVV